MIDAIEVVRNLVLGFGEIGVGDRVYGSGVPGPADDEEERDIARRLPALDFVVKAGGPNDDLPFQEPVVEFTAFALREFEAAEVIRKLGGKLKGVDDVDVEVSGGGSVRVRDVSGKEDGGVKTAVDEETGWWGASATWEFCIEDEEE